MRTSPILIRLLGPLVLFCSASVADIIDPSFRAGSLPITRGPDGPVLAMDRFPDGRIVIAGDFARVNGVRRHGIARLQPNGLLDPAFDAGAGADGDIRSMVALPDGRLLVAGNFTAWGTNSAGDHLVRLNPDGSRDHSFNTLPAWDGEIIQASSSADGTITLLGRQTLGGIIRPLLLRRLANGTADLSFAPQIPDDATINALAAQPNGGMLLVGRFSEFDGEAVTNLVRLQADGTVDGAFAAPVASEVDELFSVAIATDGRIALGGGVTNIFSQSFLAVLRPDGQSDTNFVPARGPTGTVVGLAFEAAGNLLVEGSFSSTASFLGSYRYSPQGATLDPNFSLAPHEAAPLPLPDGRVLWPLSQVSSRGQDVWSWLARTAPDGTPDSSFNPGAAEDPVLSDSVVTFALLPGGDMVADGGFSSWTNSGAVVGGDRLLRLDANGIPVPGFDTRVTYAYPGVELLLSDGAQGGYAAGGIATINGDNGFPYLARLKADGTLDTSFQSGFQPFSAGISAYTHFNEITVLGDGRIYVGGHLPSITFSIYHDIYLCRLLPNGALDPQFSLLSQTFGSFQSLTAISAFVPLDNDQLLLWGQWTAPKGPALFTYNAQGLTNAGPSVLYNTNEISNDGRLLRLPDGRILMAGSFSQVGGLARNNLAVLLPDLSVDTNFDVGVGPNSTVTAVTPLSDGRILVGGPFTRWNGAEHRRLVLLQPNGQLDPTFDPGTGPDDAPYQLTEQPDGRVLIGGNFVNIDGRGPAHLARLVIPPANPPVPAHLVLQPQAAVVTNVAVPAALKAAAIGTAPLRWQWYRDGMALTEGNGYSGVNSAQLLIQGTNLTTPAGYHVEVANVAGRERSVEVLAGAASGTMDFGFSTNLLTGKIRFVGFTGLSPYVGGVVADAGPDGIARRALVFGNFTNYDQVAVSGLIMINRQGDRDPLWQPPTGVTGGDITAAAFLPDGRLVLAGKFSRTKGAPRDVVLRLNPDGTLDDTFDPGDELAVAPPTGFPKQTAALALALDGDGLFFASPLNSTTPAGFIRRLDAGGHTDAQFRATNINFLSSPSVLAVEAGTNGGLLVSSSPT